MATSSSWWDAIKQEVQHPIDSVSSAASEIGDIFSSGGSPVDVVRTASTGHPPQEQVDAIKKQTYSQVIQAGGTEAQAQAAADEVQGYVESTGGTAEENFPSTGTLLGIGTGTIVILGLVAWILHEF